jgi:hypothetical protein
MKLKDLVNIFVLVWLAFLLVFVFQVRHGISASTEKFSESLAKENQAQEAMPKLAIELKNVLSRISFEKTVCDLGDVGPGTKNECEFRFTNTGRGLLKIGKISRTCGCTVFQLDKKEYAPYEIIHSFRPAF